MRSIVLLLFQTEGIDRSTDRRVRTKRYRDYQPARDRIDTSARQVRFQRGYNKQTGFTQGFLSI